MCSSDLLPNSIRAIFAGPSNTGKTNALLALLTHPNGLRYANVYIYSKTLSQPKYEFLRQILESIKGMRYFAYNEHDDVISPEEILPDSIIIVDDISCSKQDNVRLFFSMSRHKKLIVSI